MLNKIFGCLKRTGTQYFDLGGKLLPEAKTDAEATKAYFWIYPGPKGEQWYVRTYIYGVVLQRQGGLLSGLFKSKVTKMLAIEFSHARTWAGIRLQSDSEDHSEALCRYCLQEGWGFGHEAERHKKTLNDHRFRFLRSVYETDAEVSE